MENQLSSPLALAWAAGIFDAEGCVYGWPQRRPRRTTRRRQMEVSQGVENVEVLHRLHDALGGRGRIRGPVRGYLYYWYVGAQGTIDQLGDELWPWLGSEKRDQYVRAAEFVGRSAPSGGPWVPRHFPDRHEIAWAAGFFEGEGTISQNGRGVRLTLPQASASGVPEVLDRFRRAVGGMGWIIGPSSLRNPWSKEPQYVWGSSRFEHVQAVLAMLWPWLGSYRRATARTALRTALDFARSRTNRGAEDVRRTRRSSAQRDMSAAGRGGPTRRATPRRRRSSPRASAAS